MHQKGHIFVETNLNVFLLKFPSHYIYTPISFLKQLYNTFQKTGETKKVTKTNKYTPGLQNP